MFNQRKKIEKLAEILAGHIENYSKTVDIVGEVIKCCYNMCDKIEELEKRIEDLEWQQEENDL